LRASHHWDGNLPTGGPQGGRRGNIVWGRGGGTRLMLGEVGEKHSTPSKRGRGNGGQVLKGGVTASTPGLKEKKNGNLHSLFPTKDFRNEGKTLGGGSKTAFVGLKQGLFRKKGKFLCLS